MVTRGKDILVKVQYSRNVQPFTHLCINDRLWKYTKQKLTELKGETALQYYLETEYHTLKSGENNQKVSEERED